jgi:glycosyltransferase involved in cell wall biosynthesis
VELLGPVSNAKRAILLGGADVALNPMLSGTGSNLKMLDYFAAGIPVVSTPFGARGLDVLSGQHAVLSAIDEFPQAIRAVTAHTIPREAMIESAYELVLNRYSWETIADGLIETIHANRLFEGLSSA